MPIPSPEESPDSGNRNSRTYTVAYIQSEPYRGKLAVKAGGTGPEILGDRLVIAKLKHITEVWGYRARSGVQGHKRP